jgi:prepilin-type N-terminal cleavage/methylation domain-containing protein
MRYAPPSSFPPALRGPVVRQRRPGLRPRAFTLVELMLSLIIFSMASAAMTSLMFSTYNVNRHIKGMSDSTSQAELALRRIIEVTRSSIDLVYTDPNTGLFLQTPPDSGNLSYVFIYYIQNGQLHEKIETAGSLTFIQDTVLISNLQSFAVTRVNAGQDPRSYQVNLILATTPIPITRTATITCRNLTSG